MDDRPFTAHVQMKTETALAMTDRELAEWWGEPVADIRAELERYKANGRIYLHTEGCDNEDPVTGKCLRHYES